MFKFTIKIILIGFLLGFFVTVITMVFGMTVYYAVSTLDLFMTHKFLNYAAWVSVAIGLICTIGWYVYILALARKYIYFLLQTLFDKDKEEEQKE